jgi:hypothetical protein
MRTMFDSTSAADVPAGSELVMGYVDGSSAWSDADWGRFPGRILVRICVFNNRLDAQVIDIEPGNNDALSAVSWVRAKWLQGDTPTVYCFSDRGPIGYRISDVRKACDDAGVKRPLFLLTDFDNVPTLPADPEVIGKQYANAALTGGHYDASVVVDNWPGVDEEEDMLTVDQLLAMLNDPAVVEKINTFTAIKQVLADQAAAIKAVASAPDHVSDAELAQIVTKIGVGLEKIGADVAPPQ